MKKTYVQTKAFLPVIKELLKTQSIKLTVTGNSMKPFFIDKETIVLIEPIDSEKIQKLDVILFEINGHLVLHRIIKLGDTIITQGDALKQKEHITQKQILGIVKTYHHNNKFRNIRSRKHMFMFKFHSVKKQIKYLLKKLLRK